MLRTEVRSVCHLLKVIYSFNIPYSYGIFLKRPNSQSITSLHNPQDYCAQMLPLEREREGLPDPIGKKNNLFLVEGKRRKHDNLSAIIIFLGILILFFYLGHPVRQNDTYVRCSGDRDRARSTACFVAPRAKINIVNWSEFDYSEPNGFEMVRN